MRRRRIPGKSLFAQKAHFRKAGAHEPLERARRKRRRKQDKLDERRADRGDLDG